MRDGWSSGGEGPDPNILRGDLENSFSGASILLVEDDPDIRDLLVTLLALAGFTATACGTAEHALEELREQPFDLILTDYGLPRRSGGWLLKQASDEGLIDATPVLVVTAHPNPPDVSGFEIIQKPFDLDVLVERVRQRLEGDRPARQRSPARRAAGRAGDHGSNGDSPAPVELVLYVSAHSPRSAAAIANIKDALKTRPSTNVTLTIHDLSKDPGKGLRDQIAFTPTLVKRSPGPRTFIVGHLSDPAILLELLDGCAPEQN